jgi:hypothetical protein
MARGITSTMDLPRSPMVDETDTLHLGMRCAMLTSVDKRKMTPEALESSGIQHDCKMGVQWGIPKTIGFNTYMVQCG